MATKPTRQQQQARDHLAEALLLVSAAARLDGRSALDGPGLRELAERIAAVSSEYRLDDVVARAIEQRCDALKLRQGAADLLTLLDAEMAPLAMLALPDAEFRELVSRAEAELGDL